MSTDNGKILESTGFIGGEIVDLDDGIIAPGFLELQTIGVNGFHFSNFENKDQYALNLEEAGKFYATQGITGFWATIPTTSAESYQKVDYFSHILCTSFVSHYLLWVCSSLSN